MALTVANLVTNMDTYMGDATTNSVSAAERLQFLTEAVVWLQEETENDHQNATYTLPYLDGVHYYKITTAIPDMLDTVQVRRGETDELIRFRTVDAKDIANDIAQESTVSEYAIERKDKLTYLVVNHNSKYPYQEVSKLDSLTVDGGTWTADTTNSDALNLTVDTLEYKNGSASLNFDIDVSQSANNRATIYNSGITAKDLSDYENLASFVFWVYFPTVTYASSVTLYVGSDSSNYYSGTSTTDINGNAFVVGWNQIKVDWDDMTATSSPDSSSVAYIRFDINYTASQGDDTDYRIDDLRIIRPENLVFWYTTSYIGTSNAGAQLTAFAATNDIPYFSGLYDQYKYAVAHKSASLALYSLRMPNEAILQDNEATKSLERLKKIIPSSKAPIQKRFAVAGINFNHKNRNRR